MNARILLSFAALVVVSATPVRGQDAIGFKPVPAHEIEIGAFTDSDVDALIATLDSLLAREKDPAKWAKSAEIHFWRFSTRLNHGRLNAAQESRIRGYFNELAAKHPADAAAVTKERDAILPRLIGKVAPDIAGKDLDGVEFKLSDYRGKVVVLVFSGDWCGPCRSEYPYQRLLLEVYKDQPFAILGVNSDTLEVAKKAKAEKNLAYRAWWDGNQQKTTEGPIATAWNVTGWPTTYLLDHTGTIRFVNLRAEDVIKAVKQLMREVPQPQK